MATVTKKARGRPKGPDLVSLSFRMRADLFPELEQAASEKGRTTYDHIRHVVEGSAKRARK